MQSAQKQKHPAAESTADFKERLRALNPRPRQTLEEKRKTRPILREPSDCGYYPPPREKRATEDCTSAIEATGEPLAKQNPLLEDMRNIAAACEMVKNKAKGATPLAMIQYIDIVAAVAIAREGGEQFQRFRPLCKKARKERV